MIEYEDVMTSTDSIIPLVDNFKTTTIDNNRSDCWGTTRAPPSVTNKLEKLNVFFVINWGFYMYKFGNLGQDVQFVGVSEQLVSNNEMVAILFDKTNHNTYYMKIQHDVGVVSTFKIGVDVQRTAHTLSLNHALIPYYRAPGAKTYVSE